MINKVLILGDGELGSEIIRQTGWNYISRKKDGIDFTDINSYKHFLKDYDIILNAIGYTNTYDPDRETHWSVNYRAVSELVDFIRYETCGKKLVHISTDYIYAGSVHEASEEDVPVPANCWYSYCKLLADGYVQLKLVNYLLIRTSFKPRPFPYPKALAIQTGNFDYVDVIADWIIRLTINDARGIFNVGGETKTIYDLAKQTNFQVKPLFEAIHPSMPWNVSMNVKKMNDFFKELKS